MLIDYIVLVGIVVFSTLMARMWGSGPTPRQLGETIGVLIAIAVRCLTRAYLPVTGRTLGKWATGQSAAKNGADPEMGRAFLRHFVGYRYHS